MCICVLLCVHVICLHFCVCICLCVCVHATVLLCLCCCVYYGCVCICVLGVCFSVCVCVHARACLLHSGDWRTEVVTQEKTAYGQGMNKGGPAQGPCPLGQKLHAGPSLQCGVCTARAPFLPPGHRPSLLASLRPGSVSISLGRCWPLSPPLHTATGCHCQGCTAQPQGASPPPPYQFYVNSVSRPVICTAWPLQISHACPHPRLTSSLNDSDRRPTLQARQV